MEKEIRFVKKREWKITKPNWTPLFTVLSAIYFIYIFGHYIGIFTNIKITFWISVGMFVVGYFLNGKYPYGWKTYYIKHTQKVNKE